MPRDWATSQLRGAVVDEEGLVVGGLLTLEHYLEDGGRGLHQAALVAEVEVVVVVVDGVVAAIEIGGACPLHHVKNKSAIHPLAALHNRSRPNRRS